MPVTSWPHKKGEVEYKAKNTCGVLCQKSKPINCHPQPSILFFTKAEVVIKFLRSMRMRVVVVGRCACVFSSSVDVHVRFSSVDLQVRFSRRSMCTCVLYVILFVGPCACAFLWSVDDFVRLSCLSICMCVYGVS